jgi:CDP-6-deoxy-D-xylo-4-hexulose-3-dehydrase
MRDVLVVIKLSQFVMKRKENFQKFYEFFKDYEDFFILPKIPKKADPPPFGFILTIKDDAPFKRSYVVSFLEKNLIQTRMLFAGNIVRQPCMKGVKYRVAGGLKNTDKVLTDTFWIGVYPSEKIQEFLSNRQ